MNILGIDTSSKQLSMVLKTEDAVFSRERASGRHSTILFSDIEDLLKEAGIGISSLDAVAAGLGPGSFTGIRIAVTAVKSLAWSLEIPAGGISSFQALAAQAAAREEMMTGFICIVSDGRMNEFFAGLYTVEEGKVDETELRVIEKDRMFEMLKPGFCIAGPAAEGAAGTGDYEILKGHKFPSAEYVISETERCTGFSPVLENDLEPLYLKSSEPERMYSKNRK